MKIKKFDWYSGGMALAGSLGMGIFLLLVGFPFLWFVGSFYQVEAGVFMFDPVSFYLVVLSLFLGYSLLPVVNVLSVSSKIMLFLSMISSILCYCCCHSIWFWVFYEMSMLPLLLLLILESPYSERFIASWYLLGYVVITSLPMLLCIFYISVKCGGCLFQTWVSSLPMGEGLPVYLLLCVLFITKIPLPPFHVWLPIVHAEASSPVSMCLSGYIMKLGLLGVCRFGYYILSDYVFSFHYVLVSMCFAVLFFFSACRELDGKRWLAFLSLSHMVIASLCLCVCGYDNSPLCYLYCLGHGLSAGVTFMLLWLVYEVSGSRNWSMLKASLSSSLLLRCLSVGCVCTTASMPPTVKFFCEILILKDGGFVSVLVACLMFFYLFLSGLVPLFLVGCLLSRHYSISFGTGRVCSFLVGVAYLCIWAFVLFFVF